MSLLPPGIDAYLDSLVPSRDAVLAEMEEKASRDSFPIVGPSVGRLLYLMARLARAARILELGSGFGYSALWFARSLRDPTGKVHCIEGSADNVKMAQAWHERAGTLDTLIAFQPIR